MDSNVIVATILRNFAVRESAVQTAREGQSPQWRWTPNVVLFPDARCPYCFGSMRSNRIWIVAEGQLLGQTALVPDGRSTTGLHRLRREPPNHPHVNGTGVCQGTATSTLAALFLAMNPRGAFVKSSSHWRDWLAVYFDHTCDRSARGDQPARPPTPDPSCRHNCCPQCCREAGCTSGPHIEAAGALEF